MRETAPSMFFILRLYKLSMYAKKESSQYRMQMFFFAESYSLMARGRGVGRGSGIHRYAYKYSWETLQRNLNLCFPRKGIARPQSQFPHSCVCERSIYSHVLPTYFPAAEEADRSEEYINRSQKHECRSWDCSRAVPFLGIFV